MRQFFLYIKKMDWIMLSSVLILMTIGIAELYSIALSHGGSDLNNFKKQLFFIAIGLVLLFALAFFDSDTLLGLSRLLYLGGLLVLVGVLFFGKTVRGTQGWFQIGAFTLQPVEFIKIIAIVFLAKYFSVHNFQAGAIRHVIASGAGIGLFCLLVLGQPDFGSAMILLALWFILLVVSGIEKKYIFSMIALALVFFSLAWLFFFEDYQKGRIMTFFRPEENSLAESYNINQAIIAIGSGGIWGRGIGSGSQSQLKFLPEAQNDFIFAAIAEELGFFGVALIIFLFCVFFYRLFRSISLSGSDFSSYFLAGVLGLIFIEMFINIGMNIGLMPVVGISLPFISYGGSVIVSSLAMVGICQNIIIKSKLKY